MTSEPKKYREWGAWEIADYYQRFCDVPETFVELKVLTELEVEVARLRSMLEKANQYLKEGKAQFSPNTTNSFVDEWLADYEALKKGAE